MTRRSAVLAALLLAVAAGASAAPVWLHAATTGPTGPVPVAVAGGQAAPGVTAGALVVAAAGLAIALGRRVGTILAGAGLVVGGALVVASALGAVQGAERIAASAARALVGIGVIDGDVTVAAWPWVAAACGVAAAVLGATVPWAARSWRGPSARHEAVPAAGGPTGAPPTAQDASRPISAPRAAGSERVAPGDDPGAAWDALSRGEDPS
jgi:hypothetical protein